MPAPEDAPQNSVCVPPKEGLGLKSSIYARNLASISSIVEPWTMQNLSGKSPSARRLCAPFGGVGGGEEATIQSMLGKYLSSAFLPATVKLLQLGSQNAIPAPPSCQLSATALLEKAAHMTANSSSATAFLQNPTQMGPPPRPSTEWACRCPRRRRGYSRLEQRTNYMTSEYSPMHE